MTQKELTARLGVQPRSASEVLNKLEQADLISRTFSEADHRTTDICLIPAGEQLAGNAMSRCFPCFPSRKRTL